MNRQWLLKNRPDGEPTEKDFEMISTLVPAPNDGEFLARALYLSVDPYMRGRMRDVKSYASPVKIRDVMVGGAVSQVIESANREFSKGEIVQGNFGWQEYVISDGADVYKVDETLAPISTSLGILGMPGLTAYFGLMEVCQPIAGETVVVSAASGAVGSIVGQIARNMGCRIVGIAGDEIKCSYLKNTLGFDEVINYRKVSSLHSALVDACPNGVDVYFDNVGGTILDTVLSIINLHARIAICGMISEYNMITPELVQRPTRALLVNRARMQGLLVHDWVDRRNECITQMSKWIDDGKLIYKEDITLGIENMPDAFIGLLGGKNFGKKLIKTEDII